MTFSPFRHLPSAVFKRRPIQLTFFLTRKCNARCRFCFYLSSGSLSHRGPSVQAFEAKHSGHREDINEERSGNTSSELTLDEIKKISSSLGSLLWLAFSGGEPFLRDDLPAIAAAFYKQNKPSIILIPTNGLMPARIHDMTEAILRHCSRSTVVVKLSLDGREEVHDKLRGVPGAYQRVLETREQLSSLAGRYPNLEIGINSVFCSENQDEMPELIRTVKDLAGIRTHTVSLIRGDVGDHRLKAIDRRAYATAIKLLESGLKDSSSPVYRFSGAKLKAAQDILQRRLINDTARLKMRLIPCYAGKLTLVLTESGEVYPCESFVNHMGNVRDYGCNVEKLLESKKGQKAIKTVRNSGCHCTHECYMMMNILFNPALYPALVKEYLHLA